VERREGRGPLLIATLFSSRENQLGRKLRRKGVHGTPAWEPCTVDPSPCCPFPSPAPMRPYNSGFE
jgi:hypothetical protein